MKKDDRRELSYFRGIFSRVIMYREQINVDRVSVGYCVDIWIPQRLRLYRDLFPFPTCSVADRLYTFVSLTDNPVM